jgi:hypothetical protein
MECRLMLRVKAEKLVLFWGERLRHGGKVINKATTPGAICQKIFVRFAITRLLEASISRKRQPVLPTPVISSLNLPLSRLFWSVELRIGKGPVITSSKKEFAFAPFTAARARGIVAGRAEENPPPRRSFRDLGRRRAPSVA